MIRSCSNRFFWSKK